MLDPTKRITAYYALQADWFSRGPVWGKKDAAWFGVGDEMVDVGEMVDDRLEDVRGDLRQFLDARKAEIEEMFS